MEIAELNRYRKKYINAKEKELALVHTDFLNQPDKALEIVRALSFEIDKVNLSGISLPKGELPDWFYDECSHLKKVAVSNCGLQILSPKISQFANLRELFLGGNLLKDLPNELAEIPSLWILFIDRNPLEDTTLVNFAQIQNALAPKYNENEIRPITFSIIGYLRNRAYQNREAKIETLKKSIPGSTSSSSPLSFCLRRVVIEKYKSIQKIDTNVLPDNANWIFILGENGTGKTNVLQGIALGLLGDNDEINEQKHLKHDSEIIVLFGNIKFDSETKKNEVHTFASECNLLFLTQTPQPYHQLVLSYGVERLRLNRGNYEPHFNNPMLSLFENLELLNFQFWLIDLMDDFQSLSQKSKLKTPNFTPKRIESLYPQIINALKTTSINIEDIEIGYPNIVKTIVYTEYGETFTFKQLSAGNRTILALVGDILIRLTHAQPEVNDLKDLRGIVLIDEFDAHLHPKWQRELPTILSKLFPNVQFIVTTHSPIPLLGVESKNMVVFKITRTPEDGSKLERIDDKLDFDNLTPDLLLTSPLFDMESVVPVGNKDLRDMKWPTPIERMREEQELNDRLKKIRRDVIEQDFFGK